MPCINYCTCLYVNSSQMTSIACDLFALGGRRQPRCSEVERNGWAWKLFKAVQHKEISCVFKGRHRICPTFCSAWLHHVNCTQGWYRTRGVSMLSWIMSGPKACSFDLAQCSSRVAFTNRDWTRLGHKWGTHNYRKISNIRRTNHKN